METVETHQQYTGKTPPTAMNLLVEKVNMEEEELEILKVARASA